MQLQQMFSRKDIEQTFQRIEEDIQQSINQANSEIDLIALYEQTINSFSESTKLKERVKGLKMGLAAVKDWKVTLLDELK